MKFSDFHNDRDTLKVMTMEYTIERDGHRLPEPIVQLFCRDRHGDRRCIEVEGFYPFFYISESEFHNNQDSLLNEGSIRSIEARGVLVDEEHKMNTTITNVENAPATTLHGDNLVKVYTVEPKHVKELRDFFNETWEADVFFTNRFLIDTGIKRGFTAPAKTERVSVEDIESTEEIPDIPPRMVTIDIEVWSGGSFPNPEDADSPIISYTVHDSYDDEYISAILRPDSRVFGDNVWSGEPEWELPDGVTDNQIEIAVFDDEAEMLAAANKWITEKDPDLLTGWNSSRNDIGNGFDYPYWINRCEKINEWTFAELSPLNQTFTTNSGTPMVKGREMFDMLQAYKKTQIHEKKSYALGYIAQEELGYGKEDIESLDDGWKYNPADFMKYNIRDVSAVVEIEESKGVLDMYDHIRHVTGTSYSECADSNIGIIDVLFLRQAKDKGFALPTSTKPERGWYYGGKVFNPIPGKHENVVYPDLASLYPYLMWSLNVSPETVFDTLEEAREAGYIEDDLYRASVDRRKDEVKRDSDPELSDIYYTKPDVKEGFVREVIDDLVSMKYEYKKPQYSGEKYGAVKRIVNSCFTPDTDVLTPDGVKKITEIEVGDTVYSWNKETGVMEEKPVTETIEKPKYDGGLVHIQNRNIDLKVTPDHRMLVKRTRYSDEWETVDAGELNEYTQYETPNRWTYEHANGIETVDLAEFVDDSFEVTDKTITAGENHTTFHRFVDGDAFIELLGWYITEGSVYISSEGEARGDALTISQYKSVNDESYNRIVETVEELGVHASQAEGAIAICGSLYSHIATSLCGSGSENKHIPDFIFEQASGRQKQMLFDVLMLGDGDKNRNRYSTQSTQLRDDVIQLCWQLRKKPQYRYDDSGEFNTGVWRVHFTDDDTGNKSKQSFRMHRDGDTETAENGVYCIQVKDNHTLVAGRNGKFTNIWNCYGVFGDSASYGKGFRLFDWRLAETITLAGQSVVTYTSEEFEKHLQENGYPDAKRVAGDTDSVMTKIPSLDVSPEDIQEDFEKMESGDEPEMPFFKAAQYVNQSYDQFMHEQFWIDDPSMHKMEVEIESYADAIFFLRDFKSNDPNKGVKKRYSQLVTWDEGTIISNPRAETKGFELVRSDTANITTRVQEHVLELLLKQDKPKDAIREYLLDEWEQSTSGKVDLSDIGIPSAINKPLEEYGGPNVNGNYTTPQPHIRGAKYANAHVSGESISSGDKPIFFYVDRVGYPYPGVYVYEDEWSRGELERLESETVRELGNDMDAIAVSDVRNIPDEIYVDYEKMSNKTLRRPIEPIVKTMGWDFSDLVTESQQSGLAQFM